MSQVQTDNSVRALQQTGTAVQKLFTQLPGFVEAQLAEIQTNANTIADQAGEIEANRKAIETAVREAGAEIRLQVREDRKSVLGTLLIEDGLIATTSEALDELRQRAAVAEANAANEVAKAVKAAERELTIKHTTELTAEKNSAALKTAQLEANAKADSAQIEMLTKQVATLEATITANREAETARTTALASSSVTVNNGKQ